MKKVFSLFVIIIICINFSFIGRGVMQVHAQSSWSTVVTLISSLISGSGSGGSSEWFQEEKPVGQRDCSNMIYDYYKIETRVLPNGTVFNDTNLVGRSRMECGEWVVVPPANFDFSINIINQPRTGPERIECQGPSLSTCSPRTFTCEDNGYSCK